MIRTILLFGIVALFSLSGIAQDKTHVYDTSLDGMNQIEQAMQLAKKQGKHTLIKVGYNQCPWCVMLNKYVQEDTTIDSLLKADYVFIKVNYSKENRNKEAMEYLDFPQRFGFPVLVVLDENGKRIHTQNSLYLEKGKGYDHKRVVDFLKGWNKKAISKETYK